MCEVPAAAMSTEGERGWTDETVYDCSVLQVEGEAKPVRTAPLLNAPLLNKDTADNDDESPPPPKRDEGPRSRGEGMSGISRRTVLRGVGDAMALPWLEPLPALGQTSRTLPNRFADLFMRNGINRNNWGRQGSGPQIKPGRPL